MKIEQTEYGALTVMTPKGELVGEQAEELRSVARECLEQGRVELIIDCTHLGAYDSVGLECLLELTRLCRQYTGVLRLCGLDAVGQKILEITRLNRQFELYDDVNAAIRSFS